MTAAPYLADPTGARDSTAALQAAIEHARKERLAAYVPPGTYKVSDTITAAQDHGREPGHREDGVCYIIGSCRGHARPRLVLAPNAAGFGDPDKPKSVLHIWARSWADAARPQPNISFNQMVLHLDIEIGPGNPGAVGIHHDAAQGSGIEDVTVYAGDGYAGIMGLQSGGGGTHHITVIGGRYGLDAGQSLATAATISGATFIGQRVSAFRYNGLETCCLVGARIVVPRGATGPAIEGSGTGPTRGSMAIVDCSIEFASPADANVAIATNRSVYLNRVWVRGAGRIVAASDGRTLPGRAAGWRSVAEFAHAVQPPPARTSQGEFQFCHVNYVDGECTGDDVLVSGADDQTPPADLQSTHIWVCPPWDAPGVVSVKDPRYDAKGDGQADDTAAIQRAIDEHEVVFLPKGYYAITRPLLLRADTKLIGLRHLSVLHGDNRDGALTGSDSPGAMVVSADDAAGTAALVHLGLNPGEGVTVPALRWRTGRRSVVRSIYVNYGREYNALYPVRVTDHGGGRWYSLFKAARMIVTGTTEPLSIYQCNPEWGSQPHAIFERAVDVTLYGLKEEGRRSLLIRDSDRINVFGYGGVANAPEGRALLTVERTPNFRLVGLQDRGGPHASPAGDPSAPPGTWHLVVETTADGREIRTEAADRPVLYKRGYPSRP